MEGFSNAKTCTPAGRALMLLDSTHFLSILETLSGNRYSLHQQYVENYVKAYYHGCSLEEFITSNTCYSAKQLTGLINCACNDKKIRQNLHHILQIYCKKN